MKGNWLKWVPCRPNAVAGFNPRDCGLEPVALLGITHPDFVDDRRRDRPGFGDLRVPTVHVPATAIQRAVEQAVVDPGVIFLAN